MLSCFSWTRK